ncbi:toxin HicA [Rhodococcus sp. IEGM 1408]|uniref:toxin HicA n=1 Tax=Rhodococcus sp. IEGM 1408 TaxID=3082220 RepID=UPI0029549B6A|nr:toxin HicA [Rhodococcus sp. IEGM 1408]MDV8000778.1 toxin HicA [Rhodococcus sp. IEGM 1408]
MTKRNELLKAIRRHAREQSAEVRIVEGGNHTRVWVGERYATIPRHREIDDKVARAILKQIGVER